MEPNVEEQEITHNVPSVEEKEVAPVVLKWKRSVILMLIIGFVALVIAYIFKIK